VFFKIVLALQLVLSKVIVQKNNQNIGDFIKFSSSVIVLTAEPGMNISILINILMITLVKINADYRHLYLSVNTPVIGRTKKLRIGSRVKIKPTMTGE